MTLENSTEMMNKLQASEGYRDELIKLAKERRIVQVCGDLVLCNDGSVWSWHRGGWTRLPDIPQDEEAT